MKVVLLSPLSQYSGNHTTIHRLSGHFERNNIDCELVSPGSFKSKDEFTAYISQIDCTVILAIHAYKSGGLLGDLTVPYILILGGTDVNECTDNPDKMAVMTNAVQKSRHVVCFGSSLRDKFYEKWPEYNSENVSIIPQAVETSPSAFNLKHYIQNNIEPWKISSGHTNKVFTNNDECRYHKTLQAQSRAQKKQHKSQRVANGVEFKQSCDQELQSHDQRSQSHDDRLLSYDKELHSHDQKLQSHDQKVQSYDQNVPTGHTYVKLNNQNRNLYAHSWGQSKKGDTQKEESQVMSPQHDRNQPLAKQMQPLNGNSLAHDQRLHSHDHKMQSHDHKLQSHDHKLQSHDQRLQSHDHMLQSHGHKLQSHDQRLQSPDHKLQSHDQMLLSYDHNAEINVKDEKLVNMHDGACHKGFRGDLDKLYTDLDKHICKVSQSNDLFDSTQGGSHNGELSSIDSTVYQNGDLSDEFDTFLSEGRLESGQLSNMFEDALFFTMVGGIRAVKDPLYLVEAFSEWAAGQDENCYLLIIGPQIDEDYFNLFKKKIASLQYVIYVPGLSLRDTHAAIRDSFVLVNTSLSEGMAVSILEAMCLNTPVLARNIPGNTNIVDDGETGLLFSSVQDFFIKADLLMRQKDMAVKLMRNARRYILQNHSVLREEKSYGFYKTSDACTSKWCITNEEYVTIRHNNDSPLKISHKFI